MNKFLSAITNVSNFGARLVLSFGLLISIVVCLGLVGLKHVRADAELAQIIDARWSKVQLSRQAQAYSNLNNRITMQLFLLEDEKEINSLLVERTSNSEKISVLIKTLRTRIESPAEAQLLDAIEERRTPYLRSYQRALQLLEVDKKSAEAKAVMVQESLPLLLRYHGAWNAYADYQGNQLNQAQSTASANHFTTRIEAFSLISLAIVLAIAIAFFVTRNLTRHMARRKLAEEALRQAHAELEMKVRERTSQLAATNEELQEEIDARKLIEDELRHSEDRDRQIVESAKDMIYRLTPAGHFTFVNPATAVAVKRSVEECVGLHFLSLIRKDFRGKTLEFYQQQVREKIPVTYFEFPVIAKDGTEIWIGQNVQLEIKDGEVVELQAVGRDITTQKEIAGRLLESERRYRLLFESNPHPMWVYDVETKAFLGVNDEAVRQYGYSREEFLRMAIDDIRPREDVPALRTHIGSTAESHGASGVWRHRKKDGAIIDADITWHTLDFAGRPARLVLAIDVTERKRAQQALRESEERSRAVLGASLDAIVTMDHEGKIVEFNPAAERTFGHQRADVLGRSLADVIIPPSLRAAHHRGMAHYLASGEGPVLGKRLELSAVRADGTEFPAEVAITRINNEGPPLFTGFIRDITERKQAEAEILLQKARFEQLFANSPMAIVMVDHNDFIIAANKEFENTFQFCSSDLQGRPINEMIVSEALKEEAATLSSQALRGQTGSKQTMRKRKDGTLVPVQIYALPIIVDQNPAGVFAIYIDLTERERMEGERQGTEETLRQERSLLRTVIDSLPDAIYVKDMACRKMVANLADARNVGLQSGDEGLGKDDFAVFPKEVAERFFADDQVVLQTGHPVVDREEYRFDEQGQKRWLLTTKLPLLGEDRQIIGLIGIGRDITERKRMEAERQVIFEIIQGVIATHNLDELLKLIHHSIGKLLYADNCFVALHDPTTDLMHFEFWVDQFDPCPAPRPIGTGFSSYILRTNEPLLLDRRLTEEMVLRGEVEQSGTMSASWLGVPLQTAARSIGVLVVQHYEDEDAYDERDLEFLSSVGSQIALAIERRRAETNLRETEEQLRQSQKMESIGTLAGGIAHDFNNLMTAVTGYSELTLRSLKSDDPLRSRIEEIKKAGDRAASLTRQLLAFSRKQILQPVLLDLNTVITGMGRMLPRVIGEDIELRFDLGVSLGQVKADPGQMDQVLMNLAVNARDAMPAGGCLTIETENVHLGGKLAKRRLVVEPGHYVMLSVSDNGCGMDAETQTHIFEPFFTTKEVGKGTGLGLSTVYGIVKQSGGSIWVYSEVGRGTTFKIYLPRVDDVIEPEKSADKSRSAPRGSETILLVEDEEMVRDLSREILEEYGYAVITASNGQEGLRLCQEFEGNIDLMITDVVMPQMSGRELAEKLGALRPDTRVLYMSGFTNDAVVRHGVLDDGMCFIQKPFSPDSLALKTREVLDQNGIH